MDDLIQRANKAGQEASEQTGVAFTPLASMPVTSETTVPETDLSLPDTPPTSEAGAFNDEVIAESKLQRQLQQERADREVELAQSKTDVTSLFDQITGVNESRVREEENAGLAGKATRVTDLTNKIEAKELARLREIERIQTDSGLTREQKNARISERERVYAREIADLSIAQNAANRDFATAQANVDRKINLQLEPLKQQLEFTKFFYEDNKDAFDKADDRAFQNLIKEQDREYETEKARLKTFEDTKLRMLESAAIQGAPNAVLQAIQSATTAEEVIQATGKYAGDIQARYLNSLKIRQLEDEIAATDEFSNIDANALAQVVPGFDANTTILGSLLKNNKIGQGTRTQIANVLGVANAIGELAESRQDGKFTGYYFGSKLIDFVLPNALKKESTIQNEGFIDAINLRTQVWASGAALTADQIKQVNKLVPTKNDTDRVVRTKMNNLVNFMMGQTKTQLQSEGVGFEPAQVNLFETRDLLNEASPEQLAELRAQGLIQ